MDYEPSHWLNTIFIPNFFLSPFFFKTENDKYIQLEAYWEQLQGTYWELGRTFWNLMERVWDNQKNSSSILQPKRKKLDPPKCMLRLLVPNIKGSKIICHHFPLGLITSLTKCVLITHAPWVKSWSKIKEQHYVLKLQILVKASNFRVFCMQHAHMTSLRQLFKTIQDTNLNNLIIHWPQILSLHLGTSLYNNTIITLKS